MKQVIYTPDAIILPDSGITKIRIDNVMGAGKDDNFPINKPDGWVLKSDSFYYDVNDEYGGQKNAALAMQSNNVQPYSGYDPSRLEFQKAPYYGKPWSKLNIYTKYSLHFTKGFPSVLRGWKIQIQCEVNSSNEEFLAWTASRLPEGYDDDVAVEFLDGQITVNTKYTFSTIPGDAQFGFRPTGSDGTQGVMLELFIPLNKEDVRDRFINDFNVWQTKPKLTKTIDNVSTVEFVK